MFCGKCYTAKVTARFSWSYYSIKNMMWTLTSVWDSYQPFCFCFVVFTMNKCFLLKYGQNKTNSWSLEINDKTVEYDIISEFYKQHLFLFLFFFPFLSDHLSEIFSVSFWQFAHSVASNFTAVLHVQQRYKKSSRHFNASDWCWMDLLIWAPLPSIRRQ